jgi:hypothetical protein
LTIRRYHKKHRANDCRSGTTKDTTEPNEWYEINKDGNNEPESTRPEAPWESVSYPGADEVKMELLEERTMGVSYSGT